MGHQQVPHDGAQALGVRRDAVGVQRRDDHAGVGELCGRSRRRGRRCRRSAPRPRGRARARATRFTRHVLLAVAAADREDQQRVASRARREPSQPLGEAGVPALVVDAGGQLGDVVGRRVRLEAADLAEVVDRVAGVAGRAADAQDEQPPPAVAGRREAFGHALDDVGVDRVGHNYGFGACPRLGVRSRRPSRPVQLCAFGHTVAVVASTERAIWASRVVEPTRPSMLWTRYLRSVPSMARSASVPALTEVITLGPSSPSRSARYASGHVGESAEAAPTWGAPSPRSRYPAPRTVSDIVAGEWLVQFAAQCADVLVDDVAARVVGEVPDMFEDVGAREHLPRFRISNSSSANSFAVRSIRCPARVTRRADGSSIRSPAACTGVRSTAPRRTRARSRAVSSPKLNGLAR